MQTQNQNASSDTIPSGSAPSSAPGSPKNRIKFLCSHGGKILPRPSDGQLKYVGGETRVISVPPHISFHELMKKVTYLIDGEMILKYQVASEDLDALVTVKCDEDVGYMRDEIERIENAGITSRLRAFLFPAAASSNLTENENPTPSSSPHAIQQRYIDAINGISRTIAPKHHHPAIANTLLGSPSACSSPTSPDAEAFNNEATTTFLQSNNYHHNHNHNGRMMSMDRVRSSPNICSMAAVNVPAQQTHQLVHQHPQVPQQYVHHYPPGGPGYQSSPKPPIDPQRGERRLISVRSVGRADGVRYQVDPTPHYYAAMPIRGGGGNACCMGLHYEDSIHFPDRAGNRANSPLPSTIHLARADI